MGKVRFEPFEVGEYARFRGGMGDIVRIMGRCRYSSNEDKEGWHWEYNVLIRPGFSMRGVGQHALEDVETPVEEFVRELLETPRVS